MSRRRNNRHRAKDYNKNHKKEHRINIKSSGPSHVTVFPRKGEHPERTIKRFLKKCKKLKIVEEYRKREYYEKPTAKRKRKKAAAVKRQQKRTAEETRHLRRRPKNWI